MVLISHNALQPLAPTAPTAASINIDEPLADEYAGGGESGDVQVRKSSPPIRGGRQRSTPRGGGGGRQEAETEDMKDSSPDLGFELISTTL